MSGGDAEDTPGFTGWAVIELMGHRKIAGEVSEVVIFGSAMCRVDVPAVDGVDAYTQFYGGSAIYALTPVSEQIARGVAANLQVRAVSIYDLKAVTGDRQRQLAFQHEDRDLDDEGQF